MSDDFLATTPKTQVIKEKLDKLGKSFHQESEKTTQNGRKHLQVIYLIRDLYP